jgi:hypothetical protein
MLGTPQIPLSWVMGRFFLVAAGKEQITWAGFWPYPRNSRRPTQANELRFRGGGGGNRRGVGRL